MHEMAGMHSCTPANFWCLHQGRRSTSKSAVSHAIKPSTAISEIAALNSHLQELKRLAGGSSAESDDESISVRDAATDSDADIYDGGTGSPYGQRSV